MSDYLENAIGNALRGGGNGSSFTAPAAVYAKLHTGDPGEAGTSNAATETTRKAVEFGAASSGVISLSNSPSWTNVAATETYSHISLWDNISAGNCLGAGALTSSVSVTAGDTFNLTALTYTFT
jgi:hypothetical protein